MAVDDSWLYGEGGEEVGKGVKNFFSITCLFCP